MISVEEFVEGHAGFWDTLTVNGEVAHEFISHYYPGVLEAMRTQWISPQIVTTNRADDELYAEVIGKCLCEIKFRPRRAAVRRNHIRGWTVTSNDA